MLNNSRANRRRSSLRGRLLTWLIPMVVVPVVAWTTPTRTPPYAPLYSRAGTRTPATIVERDDTRTPASPYTWRSVTDSAAFPGSYNFPVFVVHDVMWAFHPRGNWSSTDAKRWVPSPLPITGLNTGYQKYVQLRDAIYALGAMTGNYLNLHLSSRILRTRDFRTWDTVATTSNLPPRVFYGAMTYNDTIWLVGGYDGKNYYNDVWKSADAEHWTRVTEHAAWTPRNVGQAVVFNGRMWVIGGGLIDGTPQTNPNSNREAWSSTDGVHWTKSPDRTGSAWGGTPVVFDGRLWLVGANRNSTFAPSSLVTSDGNTWNELPAPWSPRGGPAAWVYHDKLFITGGKYSVVEHDTTRFIYRNDVWSMSRDAR